MSDTPTTRASLLLRLGNPGDHEAWVEFVTLYEPVVYRRLRQSGLQDADAWADATRERPCKRWRAILSTDRPCRTKHERRSP
jgi:hypothetical protein